MRVRPARRQDRRVQSRRRVRVRAAARDGLRDRRDRVLLPDAPGLPVSRAERRLADPAGRRPRGPRAGEQEEDRVRDGRARGDAAAAARRPVRHAQAVQPGLRPDRPGLSGVQRRRPVDRAVLPDGLQTITAGRRAVLSLPTEHAVRLRRTVRRLLDQHRGKRRARIMQQSGVNLKRKTRNFNANA